MDQIEIRIAALEALVASALAQFVDQHGVGEMRRLNEAGAYTSASGTDEPEQVRQQINRLLSITSARLTRASE